MYYNACSYAERRGSLFECENGTLSKDNSVHDNVLKSFNLSKSPKKQTSQCKRPNVYHASVKTFRTPFDARAKEEIMVKENENEHVSTRRTHTRDRVAKRKVHHSSQSSKLKVEKDCADCHKIRMKSGKQNLCKDRDQTLRYKSDEPCKVIYYGPYASKRRANVNKYTLQCKNKTFNLPISGISKGESLLQRNKIKYSTSSINIRSKPRVQHHKKSRERSTFPKRERVRKDFVQEKEKTLSKRERESQYFSEDYPTSFHSKSSIETHPSGIPLAKINPNDKNFMTNSSVKHFYKKFKRRSQQNMNHNLIGGIVTEVLRRVSKSIRSESQCYRRKYRILR